MDEYNPFADEEYLHMWGVNTEEKLNFYYDESNNCRKFWIDSDKNTFNYDYRADFVLAGVASEDDNQIPFERLKAVFNLQKNVTELKSKSLFKGKDFFQCMQMSQVTSLWNLIDEYNLYIHYSHVNNFFYTIVEILDSITDPQEISEFGFDYFLLKTTFYNMLFPRAKEVSQIMLEYEYPDIKTESIQSFCKALIDVIDEDHKDRPDEKFIIGALKRASKGNELLFIQNNDAFIMQEDYSIFYVDMILKFSKSKHYFDEEKFIYDKIVDTIMKFNPLASNYEFIDSKTNTMIQLSDLIAGILGRMFLYINSVSEKEIRNTVKGLSDIQLVNCAELNRFRTKSDIRNKGLLHSTTAIGILERLNYLFKMVECEIQKRQCK